jgi:lipopolysaccharide export system permease protein
MALLVAALLGFGRLSTDRELMAMRTSGVMLPWLIAPALAVALGMSVVLGLLNMQVMPRLALQLSDLKLQLIFQTITSLQPGQNYPDFSAGGNELNFTFEQAGERPGELRGVFMLSIHEGRLPGHQQLVALTANHGTISGDRAQRAVRVELASGEVQLRNPEGSAQEVIRILNFRTLEQNFYPELSRIRNGQYRKPSTEMLSSELNAAIRDETDPRRQADLRVQRQRRWVFPFSCLTFLLVGVPFGIVTRASGKGLGLGISFLLILLYYGLLEWASAVSVTRPAIIPLAMWSPNLILGAIGISMLWWVGRK